MNFIQKRIQEKKLEQEDQLRTQCSSSISRVDAYIPLLKDDIRRLAINRRHLTDDDVLDFIYNIELLEECYDDFLFDLKYAEYRYQNTYYKNVKASSKQKAELMHQVKKEYRTQFESIYSHFKRVSIGCNFPRRNEILGLMRKAFDFDNSKYHTPHRFAIMG